MRITFERTGGFMGRKVAVDLDLDQLPADHARTLRRLLDESNFLSLEESLTVPGPARDEFQYSITVQSGTIEHSVRFTDASMPDSLRPLVEELSNLARTNRDD